MGRERKMDYRVVPNCIFTMPEVGSVGLTTRAEQQGQLKQVNSLCRPAARCIEETDGVVKIIVDAETDQVLGVHTRPHATDLIAEAALAMELGATAGDIAEQFMLIPHWLKA